MSHGLSFAKKLLARRVSNLKKKWVDNKIIYLPDEKYTSLNVQCKKVTYSDTKTLIASSILKVIDK